jgi:hypothetical protein
VYNPVEEKKNLHRKTTEIAERINDIPANKFNQLFI